jgi:hypothetical protein
MHSIELPSGLKVCFNICESNILVEKVEECSLCSKQFFKEKIHFDELFQNLSVDLKQESYELLRDSLKQMQLKMKQISFGINNSMRHIKNYCNCLRRDVQVSSEIAHNQIDNFNQSLIRKIDKYEQQCLASYTDIDSDVEQDLDKIFEEFESFQIECIEIFKNKFEINNEIIMKTNEKAKYFNDQVNEVENILDDFIFSGHKMKFEKNKNLLSESSLGILTGRPILSDVQMKDLIKLCEFNSNSKFKLIYKASQDGFEAASFHLKCDNTENTLTIIKSIGGNIFGGFTKKKWSGNQIWKVDANSFIFSFTNRIGKPLIMKCKQPSNAIRTNEGYGPTFGGGHDLFICNNSNIINKSYSNLGHSYHSIYNTGSEENQSFLAGSFYFFTSEIETYTILNYE